MLLCLGVVIALDIWLNVPMIALFITLLALMCVVELSSYKVKNRAVTLAIILQLVIVIFAVAAAWIAELTEDNLLLMVVAVIVPSTVQNMAAYYIGRFLLEREKAKAKWLMRLLRWHYFKHSPRKTLGVIVLSSTVAVVFACACFFTHPLFLVVAVLSAIFAGLGDLLESRLKRLVGVKDSGENLRKGNSPLSAIERAIASHGGFLDRLDSLLFSTALSLIPIILYVVNL
jgi:phosphatidate cytidylyltransferase